MTDGRTADSDMTVQKRHVMDALKTQFGDAVDPDVLEAVVEADFARFEDATIKDLVPVLVEKDVRERIVRRPALAGRSGV
jgi:hypothetical protein